LKNLCEKVGTWRSDIILISFVAFLFFDFAKERELSLKILKKEISPGMLLMKR
jgi:hypothetical protein